MSVLYSQPHHWTYGVQIWHGGPHLPLGVYRIHLPWVGGGQRMVLEVRAAQTMHFCENFKKQKMKCTPEIGRAGARSGQIRSNTSSRCPAAGPSAPLHLDQLPDRLLHPWSSCHLG